MGKQLSDLFKIVDKDGSYKIDPDEFEAMFRGMNFQLNKMDVQKMFDSLDFDGDGEVSMPELIADFRHCVSRDVNVLIAEQKNKEEMD